MRIEKHQEVLSEVYKTISEALDDKSGILGHQRRIAFATSLGMQQLIEIYFHKLTIIKPGTQVKHEWFKLDERNLKGKIAPIITKNTSDIPKIEKIFYFANQIESDRNDLIYGAPLENDTKLREKIDIFLELKKIIENEIKK